MESQYSDPAFENLILKEGNNICNDCLQLNPKWCSVNNAVFLCSFCARKHQSLNRHHSYVKSIEVDDWDKEEILQIESGGNIRFNLTMEEYRIPLMSNHDYKYQNKASHYYRSLLFKEVRNSPLALIKPSLVQGVLLIDRNSGISYPGEVLEILHQNRNEYESNMNKENTFDDPLKSIGDAFSEFKSNCQLAWNGTNFKETFEESSKTAKKWAQNSKEYIVDKKNKVVESQIFQNIKDKTNESIVIIKNKANQLMNNSNSNNDSNYSNIGQGNNMNYNSKKDQKGTDQNFENQWLNT